MFPVPIIGHCPFFYIKLYYIVKTCWIYVVICNTFFIVSHEDHFRCVGVPEFWTIVPPCGQTSLVQLSFFSDGN